MDSDGLLGTVYLFLSILCKTAVPIFFMLSGAFLLKKDEQIKDILRKRVLRFVITLAVITVVYHFYDVCFNQKAVGNFSTILNAFMSKSASGALWYLYTYIGLMLMLPFLRNLVKSTTTKQYTYLIALNLILVGLLPIVSFWLSNGKYYYTKTFAASLATAISIFFFLMGHFFENVVDASFYKLKNCIWLSVAAVVVLAVCAFSTLKRLDLGLGFDDSLTKGFHYTLVAVPTFSIYAWARFIFDHVAVRKWLAATISHVGQCTFGVYLVERILREQTVFMYNRLDAFLPRIVACGLWIFAMVAIGTAVVSVIKLIPGVKKYI